MRNYLSMLILLLVFATKVTFVQAQVDTTGFFRPDTMRFAPIEAHALENRKFVEIARKFADTLNAWTRGPLPLFLTSDLDIMYFWRGTTFHESPSFREELLKGVKNVKVLKAIIISPNAFYDHAFVKDSFDIKYRSKTLREMVKIRLRGIK